MFLNKQIIGLCGVAQAGKDSTANVLKGYGFKRVAFADPIRDALWTLNPRIIGDLRVQDLVNTLGWDVCKVQYPEIRRLLQVLGTEVAREQWRDDFWINLAFENMAKDNDNYVITDVRFPNEVEALRNQGAHIWKVVRPGYGPVNGHASDSYIDSIEADATIYNHGDLDDLDRIVRSLI